MDTRYNVYFAGGLLEGQDQPTVRANLGKLFKANEATLDKLFSGTAQLVKKDCDRATAAKYKQAMEKAGAQAVIKALTPDPAPATPVAPAQEAKKLTAAERIALLAAAPDVSETPAATAAQASPPVADDQQAELPGGEASLALLPEGTEVLRANERKPAAISTVQDLDLEIDMNSDRLSAQPPPPPPAPDTSHLSTAAAGETLPTLDTGSPPLSPDTSALDLAPQGTDFSDCKAPDVAAPELDLSAIDLAPEGADVLEEKYRKRHDEPAPSTDHLSLDE